VPVIGNVRPSGNKYLMEDFFYAGGIKGLMGRIKEHLDLILPHRHRPARSARTSKAPKIYNDDVIRPTSNPIYGEGALAVLKGNLAPDGCVIKPAAMDQKFLKHSGPAVVFDDYPSMKKAVDDESYPIHAGQRAGAAQCRPAGRAGHAGMGHAADAEEAAEGRLPRHAAHVRCPHVRHLLRRLRAARLAGSLYRRPAGAAEDRRHRRPSTSMPAPST
jgi:dihydroxyacid dehydratase/phosphogluconate dehydratase